MRRGYIYTVGGGGAKGGSGTSQEFVWSSFAYVHSRNNYKRHIRNSEILPAFHFDGKHKETLKNSFSDCVLVHLISIYVRSRCVSSMCHLMTLCNRGSKS